MLKSLRIPFALLAITAALAAPAYPQESARPQESPWAMRAPAAVPHGAPTLSAQQRAAQEAAERGTPDQQAFLNQYQAATTLVLQDGVNYVNPQWIDIGKDMSAMFTRQETPHQVLTNTDMRRTQEAQAAKDPAWQQ